MASQTNVGGTSFRSALSNILLDGLLHLEQQGYKIGVEQHVLAQRFLAEKERRDVLGTDPFEMLLSIGPLVCTSPSEQREFEGHVGDGPYCGASGIRRCHPQPSSTSWRHPRPPGGTGVLASSQWSVSPYLRLLVGSRG